MGILARVWGGFPRGPRSQSESHFFFFGSEPRAGTFQGLLICLVVDVGYFLPLQMHRVCEMCVWSKHAPKSVQFFCDRCRRSTLPLGARGNS